MTRSRLPLCLAAVILTTLPAACGASDEARPTAPIPPIGGTAEPVSTAAAAPAVTPEDRPTTATSRTATPAATTATLAPTGTATASGVSPRGGQAAWSPTDTPDQVAVKYASATWTSDTRIDTGPGAGQERAAQYATDSFAQQLAGAGDIGGGAAWSALASRHGWTTAESQAAATPDAPDTPTEKYRVVTVTITAHGDDGWVDPNLMPPQVMFVQLAPNPGGGWRVSASTSAPQ